MASRVLGAFVVTATATLVSLALATPASAHTPKVEAYCDQNAKVTVLKVTLTQYAGGNKNTVLVKDGGTELQPTKNFSESWSKTWDKLDATVDHNFVVEVNASDTTPKKSYDFDWDKLVKSCVTKAPPSSTKPQEPTQPGVPTQPEVPSSSVTPPSSSTPAAPAPGGSTPEPPLAATGASPLWLLLSGLGLVGAGAGTLLFLRRRRSA
ncbi:LPXTG cell wall anchor domain-containing protein [Lentzea sp. BCCO 10_0856]|uniref:LPXTG cell wall anchor domain-containing protein n=1 Tax=Lentzea miocenica TaxID=3095431 RepID=A0ABU4SXX1_9PSEU|nr:LPXTG cell wall anchor domain-containing protein [Lentzea sp. BCCO 10_0856]MDX8030741.1 LPXTG cell wall anchor domain-containing protein [Lentzea sp. BCCO 10_0856]